MLTRGSSLAVGLCLLSSAAAFGQQYTITTLAGNGADGFLDGSDLKAAQFSTPNSLTVDSKGAVYVADTGGSRVRLISGGSVSTIAGTGTAGYSGNGASATAATIWSPAGIAVGSDGAVYIAETTNSVIRKISGGNINLYAGNGQGAGYSGDNGQANVAQISLPTGLTFDAAGNLYIADSGNNLIRRVDKSGNITSYVGGTGPTAGSLLNPTGICFDSAGVLYITDSGHRTIVKFSPSQNNGRVSPVAGIGTPGFSGDGGLATKAQLNNPVGLAIDSAGNLYVADANNHRIREITTDGYIYTIAGNGTIGYNGDGGSGSAAALNFPRGVAIGPDGRVYIADTGNSVIRVLAAAAGGGVTNAGSFASRVSPGALASIFGAGFGNLTQQGDLGLITNALPTVLGGVSVTVNGTTAPLLFVSPSQINFQIPWKTTANSAGNAVVSVLVNGGSVTVAQAPLQTAAPGLFTNGAAAIVQNQDFNVNDSDHPAAAGSTIVAYLTGSGPVSPASVDGTPTPTAPLTNITSSKSAKIGSSDAVVSFAGLTPGFIGLVQFNIVVPAGLASGTYPLTVTIDGQTSNAGNIVVK
jgi:uncharacterized protein (TIGR03437 family)